MTYSADITVLGGLPVTVSYTISGPDRDVGIMNSYIDEWYITHINDRKVKGSSADWIYDKINARKGEEDRVLQAIWDASAKGEYYYDD